MANSGVSVTDAECELGSTWDSGSGTCVADAGPSGTISATSCTIAIGASTCNALVTWSTANLTANPTEVTRNNPNGTHVSWATSGTDVSNTVNFGATTFFLYHNGEPPLDSDSINVDCASGSNWDGSTCLLIPAGSPVVTNFSADPNPLVPPGTQTTLTWSSINTDSCSSLEFDTGGATSGSVIVSPVATTTYYITCVNNGLSQQDSSQVEVIVGTGTKKPIIIEL